MSTVGLRIMDYWKRVQSEMIYSSAVVKTLRTVKYNRNFIGQHQASFF